MKSKTMRRGLTLVGIASLSLAIGAGGASAGPGKGKAVGKLTAKQCAQEKKEIGKDAFDQLYGKPSMPGCKAAKAGSEAVGNAAKSCKAERAEMGADAFKEKYGKNKRKSNAFGKCVSRQAKPALSQESRAVVNAAQACRTEQADPNFAAAHEGKTFAEFYGTNPNDRNAFGKCVSTKAQAA